MEVTNGNAARYIAAKVLNDYSKFKDSNNKYFLSNTINYMFDDESDALFTSDENIFEEIRNLLSDDFELIITPVIRSYNNLSEEIFSELNIKEQLSIDDDFTYIDTIIEIKQKKNG